MTDDGVEASRVLSTITSSLLDGVRVSDGDAWNQLKVMYTPLVLRWCKSRGLSSSDALDVSQEVFLTVFRSIQTFRRDRPGDSFRSWLGTVTYSRINDHWKRLNRRLDKHQVPADWEPPGDMPPFDSTDDEKQVGDNVLLKQVLRIVEAKVSPRNWTAFKAVVMHERDPQEVAVELGMTRNQVYLAKSRILKQLRDLLGEVADDLLPVVTKGIRKDDKS